MMQFFSILYLVKLQAENDFTMCIYIYIYIYIIYTYVYIYTFVFLKRATKLCFIHSQCVVIILFNTDLYNSPFSTSSLIFCFCSLCSLFFIYSVLNSILSCQILYNICVIVVFIGSKCFVIVHQRAFKSSAMQIIQ